MSTAPKAPSLFDEIVTLFASAPSSDKMLLSRPSQAPLNRAGELLELNRRHPFEDAVRGEFNQFEFAEMLMRSVKARIRHKQNEAVS